MELIIRKNLFLILGGLVVFKSFSLPAFSVSKKETLIDTNAPKKKAVVPKWKTYIQEATKNTIKKGSAALNQIIIKKDRKELETYIYEQLQQNQELKRQIEQYKPELYRKIIDPADVADKIKLSVRIPKDPAKKSFTLTELPDPMLIPLAVKLLWDYQNRLIDLDILSHLKKDLSYIPSLPVAYCGKDPCSIDHRDFSMLMFCTEFLEKNYWIKRSGINKRVNYFKKHPELQAELFKNNNITMDLFYKVTPLSSSEPHMSTVTKKRLEENFPFTEKSYDRFNRILEQRGHFKIEELENLCKFFMVSSKFLIRIFSLRNYYIPEETLVCAKETKEAFNRWHALQLKKDKRGKLIQHQSLSQPLKKAEEIEDIDDLVSFIEGKESLKDIKNKKGPESSSPNPTLLDNTKEKLPSKKKSKKHREKKKQHHNVKETILQAQDPLPQNQEAQDSSQLISLPPSPSLPIQREIDKKEEPKKRAQNAWNSQQTLAEIISEKMKKKYE